jgi:hypothetical protein
VVLVGWLIVPSATLDALVSVAFKNDAEMKGRTTRTVRMHAIKLFEVVVSSIGGLSFGWLGAEEVGS